MFVLTTTAQDYVRHEPFLHNDTGNIIPADFDLDGDIDVYVSGSQHENCHIYENVGKGEFSTEPIARFPVSGIDVFNDSFVFDYNNDGLYDLAILDIAEAIIYRNMGNFVFREVYRRAFDKENKIGVIMDYNNDGHDDVFFTTGGPFKGSDNFVLASNGGSDSFRVIAVDEVVAYGYNSFFGVADLNNDGKDDLVQVGSYGGDDDSTTFYSYLNNGNGFTLAQSLDCYAHYTDFVDIDNDGVLELVVNIEDESRFVVYRHVADGQWRTENISHDISNYSDGHFYRDSKGQLMLLAYLEGSYYESFIYKVGSNLSSFQEIDNEIYKDLFVWVERPSDLHAVDIDNDGDMDILQIGIRYYDYFKLPNSPNVPFTFLYYNVTGEDTSAIDFDGDGIHNEADFFADDYWTSGNGINHRLSQDPDGDRAEYWDNCPNVFNQKQWDTDGDGIGDACDSSPGITELHAAIEVTSSELPNNNQFTISSTQNRLLNIRSVNNNGEESLLDVNIGPDNPYIVQGLPDGQHRLYISIDGTAYQEVYYNLFFNDN